MANGILGARDLYQNVPQAIYVNNNEQASNITVNVCNKNRSDIKVYVAISESPTTPTDAEWVEYDVTVYANGVLLRQGLMVPTGYYVVVKSSGTFTNAVVFGQEAGDAVEAPITITTSPGSSPVWETPSSFYYTSSWSDASYQLEATGPEEGETITYALTSGSLPAGTSLSSTGLITGETTGEGTSTATIRATDSLNNVSTRTFSIIRRYLDGSTEALAAPSGYHIAQNFPSSGSGYYWIKSATMPNALQMYVDMSEDGGGYDFYAFDGTGVGNDPYVNGFNSGLALGLDIISPRSKYHWRAMANFVYYVLGKRGNAYQQFFRTTYGISKPTPSGNYTSTIMRDAVYYGSGSSDHFAKDGGRWWLRDTTFGEPNGDYDGDAYFGLVAGGYTFPEPYGLQDIGFNDGTASYSLGKYYLVSTNGKP